MFLYAVDAAAERVGVESTTLVESDNEGSSAGPGPLRVPHPLDIGCSRLYLIKCVFSTRVI